jgi:hypothetical protein
MCDITPNRPPLRWRRRHLLVNLLDSFVLRRCCPAVDLLHSPTSSISLMLHRSPSCSDSGGDGRESWSAQSSSATLFQRRLDRRALYPRDLRLHVKVVPSSSHRIPLHMCMIYYLLTFVYIVTIDSVDVSFI